MAIFLSVLICVVLVVLVLGLMASYNDNGYDD